MTENEAIELLRSMQNPKQDYADVVCAPAFCTGFRFVYPEPEDYAIEEAIKALKEIQQYREVDAQIKKIFDDQLGLVDIVKEYIEDIRRTHNGKTPRKVIALSVMEDK